MPLETTLLSKACASRINPWNSNEGSRREKGRDRKNETLGWKLHFLALYMYYSSSPPPPKFQHSSPLCLANKWPVKLFNERSAAVDFLRRATHPCWILSGTDGDLIAVHVHTSPHVITTLFRSYYVRSLGDCRVWFRGVRYRN